MGETISGEQLSILIIVIPIGAFLLANLYPRRSLVDLHHSLLTLLEGFTCLRAFEISQAWDSMHSLNPTSWPVLCLLYAFMITPCSLSSNERLRKCHPQAGSVLMLCNACVPILTISLFALVRDDTNIFFMNSTHVGYRILEFNLGSCFYT